MVKLNVVENFMESKIFDGVLAKTDFFAIWGL